MPTPNHPSASVYYMWGREDGKTVILGGTDFSSRPTGAVFHVTEDHATAKIWARELAAGRKSSRLFNVTEPS